LTDIELEKLHAETIKLQAEAAKLHKDLKWYEVILIVSATVAFTAFIAALTKIFF
jgi:cell division protein FtsB